jgi:beta propeller repeat protein
VNVVYQDDRNGNIDIYCYNLMTGLESQLTSDTADQTNPAISGTRVVYEDRRNSDLDLYLYDLAANREVRLATDTANQYDPDVYGNRVAFEDSRFGNPEIFVGEISAPRVTAVIPTSTNYVGGPRSIRGRLTSFSGVALGGRTVVLESSPDRVKWTSMSSAITKPDGTYYVVSSFISGPTYLRVSFPGDADDLSAQSSYTLLKPKVLLLDPVAPSRMHRYTAHTVYGYLTPRHHQHTYPVRIYRYLRVGDRWVKHDHVHAIVHDSPPTPYMEEPSRYSKSMTLPHKGEWRLRAYAPADAKHAATWSPGYEYVKVR